MDQKIIVSNPKEMKIGNVFILMYYVWKIQTKESEFNTDTSGAYHNVHSHQVSKDKDIS